MPPGRDFVDEVEAALQKAYLMVLVIGPRWLSLMDPAGNRKIDNPDDLHRAELRSALQRGIRMFPVLVDRAEMPRPDQLPEDIRKVARIYAIELSDHRWERDIQQLCDEVTTVLQVKSRENKVMPPASQ